jgi:hypothetical protein
MHISSGRFGICPGISHVIFGRSCRIMLVSLSAIRRTIAAKFLGDEARMKLIIIAIDHGWQMVRHGLPPNQWPAEETQLQAVVTDTINSRGVDLICEESDPCRLSIAQKLAFEHTPRIPWKNVTMTAQERIEAGIYEALLNRPSHAIEMPPPVCWRAVEHRIPEDATREQFFSKEIVQAVDANGSKSGLVLCGDMHVDFLKQLLDQAGYKTQIDRSLIPQKFWQ